MEVSLSTFRKGLGVHELFSESLDEYWATDDVLPHLLTISFNKYTYVHSLKLYLNFEMDDSYTPEKFKIYFNKNIVKIETKEINGEIKIPIGEYLIELNFKILENHSDGKDSRLRRFKVMAGETEEIKMQ